MKKKDCMSMYLCTGILILMGAGLARGEVNNTCTSSTQCNRNCFIGTCVFVLGGGGHCEYAPKDCDDNKPCTDDKCRNDVCFNVEPICNNDNLFCTADKCVGAGSCEAGTESPCTSPTPVCDEFLPAQNRGRCVECTDEFHCVGNPAGPVCDRGPGQCVECTELAPCGAALPHCINGVCKECLSVADCDDIACFQVACGFFDNTCHYLDDCAVSDGQFCNGEETCDGVVGAGTCLPGVQQCTALGQTCDEINDECIGCTLASPCQQDLHACTTHTCDLSQGVGFCVVTTDDVPCGDGLFCNGVEICDAQSGCVAGPGPCSGATPLCFEDTDTCGDCMGDVDCNDNVACTADTCGVDHLCQFADTCDDGDSCNGLEICDTTTGGCSADPSTQQDCWPLFCFESQCVECVYGHDNQCDNNDPRSIDTCTVAHTCDHDFDIDNDGVPNDCDNCDDTVGLADKQCGLTTDPADPNFCGCVPETPVCANGKAVEGCDCSQLDHDNDGVYDCGEGFDLCPCIQGCPAKRGCPCLPGEACCDPDPTSLCYCGP